MAVEEEAAAESPGGAVCKVVGGCQVVWANVSLDKLCM